jgi:Xaa-Pro aminopeptidase
MTDFGISVPHCRIRQQRLLEQMQRQGLDLVIVSHNAHVQWLTGCHFSWLFSPIAALTAEGHCTLVAPARRVPAVAAADDLASYEAQWHSTLRNDQRVASSAVLLDRLAGRVKPRRIGVDYSSSGPQLVGDSPWGTFSTCQAPAAGTVETRPTAIDSTVIDIEPTIYYLRRRKEADELALMKKAIAATGRMYERARHIVEPGINELEVFSQLQAVATDEFGEPQSAPAGNDYACNARGGPPRDRRCQDGELYILDLGPAFRGYFSDNCRTLAVNRRPTDLQQRTWEAIAAVFPVVQSTVKPGLSCKAFFEQIQRQLDEYMPGVFNHHLGHGVGLFPHEAPHLNPRWDDQFEVGDVVAVEPGLYSPELRAGIRLENQYLVTDSGVELLTDFPLEL